jgi:hypothetical protein
LDRGREEGEKVWEGGNEASGWRPLIDLAQARDMRGVFRAKSALPTCEARFELLNRAGLRGYFGVSWAVPSWNNRATKHLNCWNSRLGRESLG